MLSEAARPKLYAVVFTGEFMFEDFPYPSLQVDQIAKITEWNSILASHVSR